VKEITTPVTCHISSFDQYDPWNLSHDIFKSLSTFVLYQGISIDSSDYFITSIYFCLYFCFLFRRTTVRMSQRKSTSFSAAKVANFGVVMAEMVLEMSELRKEVKRLRHHVSVLSKRNDRLMKDGKSGAASSIASDASLSSDDEGVGEEEGSRVRVVKTMVGEEAREKAHGDGIPAP